MTRTIVEELRPLPAVPEPGWAEATLREIVASDLDHRLRPIEPHPRRNAMPRVALVAACLLAVGLIVPVAHQLKPAQVVGSPVREDQPRAASVLITDVGPLPAAAQTALVSACWSDIEPAPVTRVDYASRIENPAGAPLQAAVVSDSRGEYRVCISPHPAQGPAAVSGYGPRLLGPGGKLTPTLTHPIRQVAGLPVSYTRDREVIMDAQLVVAYATAASVERVQVRIREAGGADRWFEGRASGGFVVIPVLLPRIDAPRGSQPNLVLDARAYDKANRKVAVDHQPDFGGAQQGSGNFWGE